MYKDSTNTHLKKPTLRSVLLILPKLGGDGVRTGSKLNLIPYSKSPH